MTLSLLDRYASEVKEGRIERDEAQAVVLKQLEAIRRQLNDYRPPRKNGTLGRLLGSKSSKPSLRGLYIWGSVGRGKTMLMDLFFEEVLIPRKQRVHFHAFMADVHARVHAWRQELKRGTVKGDDPIVPIAEAIAKEAWLLCFDEFTVTDIADAMILGRLFSALFVLGVIVVATSNVDPEDLYKDGLNRALFLPFIATLKQQMEVVQLDARADFRLEKLEGQPVYYVPANVKAAAQMTQAFKTLTGMETGQPLTLHILGRQMIVPQARGHVARFSFAELCEKPLGAADYLSIAEAFHTVLLESVPILEAARRNEVKRFITLIDALYDQHVKLIISAEAEPDGLYLGVDGREAFEFARTVSRLIEMRSEAYMSLPHGSIASIGSGNSSGLVET
jgi:cell division protein ZapE